VSKLHQHSDSLQLSGNKIMVLKESRYNDIIELLCGKIFTFYTEL